MSLCCCSLRFKGVAGTHAIVSVTSEELSGRTYPSTIRKGKGEQVKPGLGLLYMLLVSAGIKTMLHPQECMMLFLSAIVPDFHSTA